MRRWRWFGRQKWLEATNHDISILPGGFVLHHSICWCKTGVGI